MSSQIEVRARGSLALPAARELRAVRDLSGAYRPDGGLDPDTPRFWGARRKAPDPLPDSLADQEVVEVYEEEVVWGGRIMGHYGHFLTESVARFWPLLPGARLEGRPVVFVHDRRPPFAAQWLEAFGVQVVTPSEQGATCFRRMFVPEPACRLNAWLAPELRDVHLHARRGMDVAQRSSESEVLWLSRSGLGQQRGAYDELMLEWILGDHVSVIRPEAMTLAEQIGAIESATAVAGVIGSAFHTLLMAASTPLVLALCPAEVAPTFHGQDRLLGGTGAFVQAMARTEGSSSGPARFPTSYRVLIPEALRALSETVLPELRDDPQVAALAFPERLRLRPEGPSDGIQVAVARVLLDPLSVEARTHLGDEFAANEVDRCALEQFLVAADLAGDHVYPLLKAARVLSRMGQVEEAASLGKRVLAIDPGSREAPKYVTHSTPSSA